MVDSPPEEEVTGTWWAQEKPEEKFYGRLAFGNSTPTLELEGAPAEDLQRDEVAPPRTFHGEALSRTFTIHRVVLSETRWSGPRAQVSYRAQAVIEGCLIDPNRTLLRDVFVRFAGLERWIGDDVFRTNFAWDDDEARQRLITGLVTDDQTVLDVVEVSPPYDQADITALLGNRVVLEALTAIARRRKDDRDGTTWDPRQPLLDR